MIKPYFETKLGKQYHGDCLEIMKEFPDNHFDLCLTDPPYGINMHKNPISATSFGGGNTKKIKPNKYIYKWDEKRVEPKYFHEVKRISKNQMVFGGNYYTDILGISTHWIVWDKKNTLPSLSDCELVWTSFDRKSTKLFDYLQSGLLANEKIIKEHPTTKPVGLIYGILLQYSKENYITIDPFFGSGTTGVACERLGRRWLGIEIEERYCEIAAERIKAESQQGKLFETI
jgi:DNA modification methylase